jgi:hypothetical protein
MVIDGDRGRSASHLNLLAHLSGPFRGGAVDVPVRMALAIVDGEVQTVAPVEAGARRPLLVVGTRAAVGPRGFSATIEVTPAGSPSIETTVRFAPFTEEGAFLPVWASDDEVGPALDCVIRVAGPDPDASAAELVELRLVEGVLGRLLYVLGAEKARLRRQARELFALRRLDFELDDDSSRDHRRLAHAIDRLGADLGVPRFVDQLIWDADREEVVSQTRREPNESYRQRIAMMRRFLLPTHRRVVEVLRDSGTPFAVNEANADFAVALQLVSSADGSARQVLLDHLRAAHLVQPGQPIPASRPLPSQVRAALQAVLDRVGGAGGSFELPAGAFVAPLLAEALDRVGRCRIALGVTRRWRILRAQDDAGGSRYEFGLGVDVEALPAGELDLLAKRHADREYAAGTDLATVALLDALTSRPASEDPLGRWLLAAAGLRTAHPIDASRWYLSHFPVLGMVLSASGGAPLELEARFHAPGEPGPTAALWFAMADVTRDAASAGLPAFTELPAAAAAAAIAAATIPTAVALDAFDAAGLRTPADADNLARAKAELIEFPAEVMSALSLAPALAAGLLAGTPQSVQQLARLVDILAARELVSALPLVSGGGVVLLVSTATLPGSPARFNSPRQGFRWYLLPITGLPGALESEVGARNRYTAPNTGATLAAVVAVALARRDRADPRDGIAPYEVRVQLPPGQRIDLAGYERLVNTLRRAVPIGVVVNTRPVRTGHIDPAGDGTVVPFTGRLAQTFRAFKQRRHLGTVNSDSEQ